MALIATSQLPAQFPFQLAGVITTGIPSGTAGAFAVLSVGAARAEIPGRLPDLPFGTPRPELVSSLATGYVGVPVEAFDANGLVVDVTKLAVQLAFPVDGAQPATWYGVTWHQGVRDVTGGVVQWADVLIGSGGATQLTAGDFRVWAQVVASPQSGVFPAPGRLVVI